MSICLHHVTEKTSNCPKDFPSHATVSTELSLPYPRDMKSLELAKGNFSSLHADCMSSAPCQSWASTFHNSPDPVTTTTRQVCSLQPLLFLFQGFCCLRMSVCGPQVCVEQDVNNQCDNVRRWAGGSWTGQCPAESVSRELSHPLHDVKGYKRSEWYARPIPKPSCAANTLCNVLTPKLWEMISQYA